MNINTKAIVGMAIATASYNRDWIKDTSIYEMYEDFPGIISEAELNIEWAGIKDYNLTEEDVAESLFGMDEDEFAEFKKEYQEEYAE